MIPKPCYVARFADSESQITSALRLRHRVFNIELRGKPNAHDDNQLEFDSYDSKSRHLIVSSTKTGEVVGTYRLNTLETVGAPEGFYSAKEFTIEDLPDEVLAAGVEIGRACVASAHRNTNVLFLLWKALLEEIDSSGKKYLFGCSSIFAKDENIGKLAYRYLAEHGHLHPTIQVHPRKDRVDVSQICTNRMIGLPPLFKMYLRVGAKVCGPPMVDHDFGTIDFFVLFDKNDLSDKYRRMFAK